MWTKILFSQRIYAEKYLGNFLKERLATKVVNNFITSRNKYTLLVIRVKDNRILATDAYAEKKRKRKRKEKSF